MSIVVGEISSTSLGSENFSSKLCNAPHECLVSADRVEYIGGSYSLTLRFVSSTQVRREVDTLVDTE